MASHEHKNPTNINGPYYVDDTCIDCDQCRNTAPTIFRRDDDLAVSVAYHQPRTPEEWALAEEALTSCPTDSIGNDGAPVEPPQTVR